MLRLSTESLPMRFPTMSEVATIVEAPTEKEIVSMIMIGALVEITEAPAQGKEVPIEAVEENGAEKEASGKGVGVIEEIWIPATETLALIEVPEDREAELLLEEEE